MDINDKMGQSNTYNINTTGILLWVIFLFYFQNTMEMEQDKFRRIWKCDKNNTDIGSTYFTFLSARNSNLRCATSCSTDRRCIAYQVCVVDSVKFCRLLDYSMASPCVVSTSSSNFCTFYTTTEATTTTAATTTTTDTTPTTAATTTATDVTTTATDATTTSTDATTTAADATTTANPCYNNGNWNGVQCTCERGCSGTFCGNCYKDCYDGKQAGESGIGISYIKPTNYPTAFQIMCNFDYGVSYIQYRRNGSLSFANNWTSYKEGFGDLSGDYWIGNDKIHAISSERTVKLGAVMFVNGTTKSETYYDFNVDSEINEYRLTYTEGFSVSSLSPSDTTKTAYNQPFRTYDRDSTDCAEKHASGWWFNTGCSLANANAAFPLVWGSLQPVTMTRLGLYP